MKQGNLTHKFNKSEKLAFITLQMSVFSYGIFDYYCNAIENPCIFIVGCVCVCWLLKRISFTIDIQIIFYPTTIVWQTHKKYKQVE